LPGDLFSGPQPPKTPVFAARTLDGRLEAQDNGQRHEICFVRPDEAISAGAHSSDTQYTSLLMIDGNRDGGNRDGRLVLFPHDHHVEKLMEMEGIQESASCATCHHLDMPFDTNTSCAECHRDMYVATDIFDHSFHVDKHRGNDGCTECHEDSTREKTRDTASGCTECHEEMMVADSLIEPPADGMQGFAVGYMDAMHGLCISCHEQELREDPERYAPDFADCIACHRDTEKPYEVDRSEN